jgi:hypothetical protein
MPFWTAGLEQKILALIARKHSRTDTESYSGSNKQALLNNVTLTQANKILKVRTRITLEPSS